MIVACLERRLRLQQHDRPLPDCDELARGLGLPPATREVAPFRLVLLNDNVGVIRGAPG
jgi:hypothetical protein